MGNTRISMLLLVVIFWSCGEDHGPTSHDVYITGSSSEGAVYWKNDVRTLLPGGNDFYPLSIFVSGEDVYVAGLVFNDNVDQAMYVKNGVKMHLEGALTNAYSIANDIAVSGSDVYVVGISDSLGREVASLWKNGVRSYLPAGLEARAVAVSGNDVYITGTVRQGNWIALWKNGVLQNLTPGGAADAFDITTLQGNVFVAGNVSGFRSVATYWKNGLPYPLSDGVNNYYRLSISLSGNDVYVGATESNSNGSKAMYWKNGAATYLADHGLAHAIQAFGSDVYVVGRIDDGVDWNPAYWKNGALVTLGQKGVARALFVK